MKSKSKKSIQRKCDSLKESGFEEKSSQYEPVHDLSLDSPLRAAGNLTGPPRRLKDLAAEWYNARAKWNKQTAAGFNICTDISNIKIQSFDGDSHILPSSLLLLCESLNTVLSSLAKLITKMSTWRTSLDGLMNLAVSKGTHNNVIFQTWTLHNYIQTAEEVLHMYKQEHALKQYIKENICHCTDRNQLLYMLACWSHGPYINDVTLLNIDAMCIETGHQL